MVRPKGPSDHAFQTVSHAIEVAIGVAIERQIATFRQSRKLRLSAGHAGTQSDKV